MSVLFKHILQKNLFLALIVGSVFFFLSFITLPHYGISWDEPTHFKRGQGYLWFYLTGDNDYRKLPAYDLLRAQNDPGYHERSIYQDDKHNSAFYKTIDGSHPPFADILSSATNMIFYQKLGWMGDIESYHLFEIFVASIAVGVLFLFVYEGFGFFTAILAVIFFATYPLFWAESHFNIKDPVETTWFVLTLYFFWKGIRNSSTFLVLVSSIFAGFALGTKLNIIFLPFILLPWLLFILRTHKVEFVSFLKTKKFVAIGILYPIVVFAIFYFSYPFLWDDPLTNIGKVATYYQKNALDPAFANAVLPQWSYYALRWVVLTAPPLVLVGLFFSLVFFKPLAKKSHGLLVLAFIWLAVTVGRVSVPGVNIYGGIRQIMEFIPPISILSAVGFSYLLKKQKRPYLVGVVLIVFFVSVYPLIKLHPNENVYFNFLVGGLKGAVEVGVPAAGNSFGNAYYQGIIWINENVAQGARLAIIQGGTTNIPRYKLRSDIDLSNDHFSGINRLGEYLVVLSFNYEHRQNHYAWEYVEKYLNPVYEVKADDVSILKVWKNDLEHTRPNYQLTETEYNVKVQKSDKEIIFQMDDILMLSRVGLSFDSCSTLEGSLVFTSLDGENWVREKDPFGFIQIGRAEDSFKPAWEKNILRVDTVVAEDKSRSKVIEYYFAGRSAKYVKLVFDSSNSCLANYKNVKVWGLSAS